MMFPTPEDPTSRPTDPESSEFGSELAAQPLSDTIPCPPPDGDDLELSNPVVASTE